MLYNVYIKNNVAIKVTEYNSKCVPCNKMDSIPSDEIKIMKIDLPKNKSFKGDVFNAVKSYINLNNLI